jgi:ribosomal protein S18 acetylase RimI-like enzyme
MPPIQKDVFVRRAQGVDFPVIQQLVFEMDAFHHANSQERIKPADAARLKREDFDRFLAKKNEAVIGFVRAKLQDAPEGRAHRARRTVLIHEVVIHSSARRLGAGKKLIAEVCDWAGRHGAMSLELSVYAFNEEAISFYRSLGFSDLTLRLSKKIPSPSVA